MKNIVTGANVETSVGVGDLLEAKAKFRPSESSYFMRRNLFYRQKQLIYCIVYQIKRVRGVLNTSLSQQDHSFFFKKCQKQEEK